MKSGKIIQICLAIVVVCFFTALAVTKIFPWLEFRKYHPVSGDLIFQSLPYNDLVQAIEGISESPFSHCGIVIQKDGEWYVLEAIGPVKYTPLYEWVKNGRAHSFKVFRLKDSQYIDDFISKASGYLGRPYDKQYRMDDEKIYCSELIYKAYRDAADIQLGQMVKLGDMPWEKFQSTIINYEKGAVPLEREIITPVNITKSEHLKSVFNYGY